MPNQPTNNGHFVALVHALRSNQLYHIVCQYSSKYALGKQVIFGGFQQSYYLSFEQSLLQHAKPDGIFWEIHSQIEFFK